MYVIQRSDGKFVTHPGQRSSYTALLQDARVFDSREAAARELCPENERVVQVRELLHA
jgi:hypothetical protein